MIQNWSNLHSSIGFVVTVFIDHIICCQARITTKLIKFAFSGSVSGKTWSWTSSWAWTTSRCTGLKPQHCPFAFRALNPQSLSFGTFNNHWCTSSFLHQPIFVIYVTQRTSLMFFVTESLDGEGSAVVFTIIIIFTNLIFVISVTQRTYFYPRIIGRGGFGEVYGCRKADTGKMYAMKVKTDDYHDYYIMIMRFS